MAASAACSKCKCAGAAAGDSWCQGCLALEAAQGALRTKWFSAGHRRLAEELLLQSSRQVRALRDLDIGLRSLTNSFEDRLKSATAKRSVPDKRERSPTPRPRASRAELGKEGPVTQPVVKEEAREDEEDEFEEESAESYSETESPRRVPAAVATSAKSRAEPSRRGAEERGASRDRSRSVPLQRRRRARPGKRAGKKHQRRYRHLRDPDRVQHRPLGREDLRLEERAPAGAVSQRIL